MRQHAKTDGTARRAMLRELQTCPGVGPRMAEDLLLLGVHSLADLARRDPERLYEESCARAGGPVDRCVLYVFRCAVYFASHDRHEAELLKWWNWKARGPT
jgi:hypothetical protein